MTVDLPKGVWFGRSDGTRYEGGETVVVPTPVNETPVLVRAGAFLPLANVVQTTRDYSTEQLTLHWYADASVATSVGRMIEDDGRSRDSNTASALDVLKFAGTVHDGGRKVSVKRGGQGYDDMPETRTITLVVHNQAAQPTQVRIDGRDVGNEQLAGSPVVSYAPKTRELRIRFEHAQGAVTIEIED